MSMRLLKVSFYVPMRLLKVGFTVYETAKGWFLCVYEMRLVKVGFYVSMRLLKVGFLRVYETAKG